MKYTTNLLAKYLLKSAFGLIALLTPGYLAYAQPAPEVTFASTIHPAPAPAYESIYVVITSHTDKQMLEQIENKLKKWNITCKATEINFTNGLLTNITLVVDIPGVYKATSTYGNGNEPLSEQVVFYHETSKGAGLSNGVPKELSARGKLVVTNNLKGILIMYDEDNTEFSGTMHTNWKSE
jgi:hypothetical protein